MADLVKMKVHRFVILNLVFGVVLLTLGVFADAEVEVDAEVEYEGWFGIRTNQKWNIFADISSFKPNTL